MTATASSSCATSCPPTNSKTLTAQVNRYVREVVPTLPDQAAFYQDKDRPETLKQLQHMGNYDAFFAEYRNQPRWKVLAETLIGEAAQVSQPEWFNKPPQTEHPHAAASGQLLLQPQAAQRRLHLAGPRPG